MMNKPEPFKGYNVLRICFDKKAGMFLRICFDE